MRDGCVYVYGGAYVWCVWICVCVCARGCACMYVEGCEVA